MFGKGESSGKWSKEEENEIEKCFLDVNEAKYTANATNYIVNSISRFSLDFSCSYVVRKIDYAMFLLKMFIQSWLWDRRYSFAFLISSLTNINVYWSLKEDSKSIKQYFSKEFRLPSRRMALTHNRMFTARDALNFGGKKSILSPHSIVEETANDFKT